MKKTKETGLILRFSPEELKDKRLIKPLNDLVILKLSLQRGSYIEISEVELQVIKILGAWVPLERYKEPKFENEVGKFRGRRVVLKNA